MADNQILKAGQKVHTAGTKAVVTVDKFLGGGGQGEVYRATLGGKPVALKWYFPAQATMEQKQALDFLVSKGPPSDRFLWPMELAHENGVPGYGYVMPLRPPQYKGVVDVFFRRVEPSMRVMATLCLNMADTFLQLHSKGLCYRDISHGNVFFDPNNGDVLICDCDNVGVTGSSYTGVTGTSGYSAPEIERHEALPSTQTDLHSLAVLMFKILTLHHPLEGLKETSIKCFDMPAREKLYGHDALFVFDTKDNSNRPDNRYHQAVLFHWPIYPKFIRDLFTKAFTVGLDDPQNGRVRESEWRGAMVKLRDSIIYCACGAENFYCADALKDPDARPVPPWAPSPTFPKCWSCKADVKLPPRLRVGRHVVMLNHDTKLYPHHLDDTRLYDFSTPLAEVTQHPQDPSRWGIKNLSIETWKITRVDGTQNDVEPGRNLPLAVGIKVHFGKTEGEIRL